MPLDALGMRECLGVGVADRYMYSFNEFMCILYVFRWL